MKQRSPKINCQRIKVTKMKNLFATVILISTMSLLSCKKTEDSTGSATLTQLQHKWMFVSRRGEVLRIVGTPDDYYNFSTDNILYRRVAQISDTSYYQLSSSNNSMLLVYPIINGTRSGTFTNYYLTDLSDTTVVISWGTSNPTVSVTDSLRR